MEIYLYQDQIQIALRKRFITEFVQN